MAGAVAAILQSWETPGNSNDSPDSLESLNHGQQLSTSQVKKIKPYLFKTLLVIVFYHFFKPILIVIKINLIFLFVSRLQRKAMIKYTAFCSLGVLTCSPCHNNFQLNCGLHSSVLTKLPWGVFSA